MGSRSVVRVCLVAAAIAIAGGQAHRAVGGAQTPAADQRGASVSAEQFDRWMTELSNWGRWGKDDQLGALNLITAAKRRQATALVTTGTVVSLSRALAADPPAMENGRRPPVLRGSLRHVFEVGAPEQWVFERQEIEYHGGVLTHLDALCHVAYKGRIYNGLRFEEIVTREGGCSKMGVGALKDGIVTRGILLDIPGTRVRREDIEAWEKRTGVKITSGDALLLRTGRDAGSPARTGGYDPSLAPFLKARDIALLGSDIAQEGGSVPGVSIPIHRFALVALGVHLFDNLDLEALARTAAAQKRWEFLVTAAPLPVPNGAGAAVNPIAVF